MKQRHEGTAQVTASAGRRVALRGAQAGLSVQALADRCAELGLPLGRVTLSKLELGMRASLNIGELLVLAAALDMPPAELVFPAGLGGDVEVLPGQTLPAWDAAKWLSGDARLEESPGGPRVVPAGYLTAVPLHREHDRLIAGLSGITSEMTLGDDEAPRMRRRAVIALWRGRA